MAPKLTESGSSPTRAEGCDAEKPGGLAAVTNYCPRNAVLVNAVRPLKFHTCGAACCVEEGDVADYGLAA